MRPTAMMFRMTFTTLTKTYMQIANQDQNNLQEITQIPGFYELPLLELVGTCIRDILNPEKVKRLLNVTRVSDNTEVTVHVTSICTNDIFTVVKKIKFKSR